MKRRRVGPVWVAMAIVVSSSVGAAESRTGRVAVEVIAAGQQFLAVNASNAPITPRIIIRGWTDRDGFPPRHAAGLTLNGISIMPARMLTGATWILEPDGSAKWGYLSGTWSRAEGTPDDPRLWVFDPEKMWLDHFPPLARGAYGSILTVAAGGAPRTWTCRIEFPAGAVVKKLVVSPNAEQCGAGKNATAIARAYADPECETLIAERAIDFATGLIVFDDKARLPKAFYIQLTARDVKSQGHVGLYYVSMWAELDAAGLPRFALQPGLNAVTVGDSEASSHQWRILLEAPALRDNPPPAPPPPPPAFVTNHVSRFRANPVKQDIAAPADFFPLGFYARPGSCGDMDFTIDDMADLNCNCIHGSNMGPEYLKTLLDLLDRSPLKVIYQGGSSGALYYQSKGYFGNDVEKEVAYNERDFKPSARKYLPLFRNRPGLLAWSIAEEVPPDVPQRLHDKGYYALMRELDPTHPPVFLHNGFEAAKNDLELNRPAAITHDRYPFSLDPRSTGPTSLAGSVSTVLGATRQYRRLCDAHDVPLWFMGQCFGEPSPEQYTSPPYGRSGGSRTLSPAVIRMQGWAAIAEGARGLFFFVYGPGDGAPRDRYWRKTEQWDGVKTLFGELQPLAPLLLRLKRAEDKDGLLKAKDPAAPLTIRVLTRRGQPDGDAKGLYAVVFNRNDKTRVAVALEGEATQKAEIVWDVKRWRAAADMSLDPGEGTLLWIGSRDQLAADRALLGTRQRPQ